MRDNKLTQPQLDRYRLWLTLLIILIGQISPSYAQSQAFTLSYDAVTVGTSSANSSGSSSSWGISYSAVTPYNMYVTASALNIRSGPSTGYSQIGLLQHGEKVVVVGHSGSWRKISRLSHDAYVHGDYLSLTPQAGSSSHDQSTQISEHPEAWENFFNPGDDLDVSDYHATVTASALNVRKGPGTEHGIHQSIPNGSTVKVTHHQGIWLRIEWSSGALAYVHGNYLKRNDPFEGVADPEGLINHPSSQPDSNSAGTASSSSCDREPPTAYIENYNVKVISAIPMNLQPRSLCPPIGFMSFGQQGRVIARSDQFVYLQNSSTGQYGWVYEPATIKISSDENDFPDFEPGYGPGTNNISEAAAKMGIDIELPIRGRDVDRDVLIAQMLPEVDDPDDVYDYYYDVASRVKPDQFVINPQSVDPNRYWTPTTSYSNDDRLGCIGWHACKAAWDHIRESGYHNLSDEERRTVANEAKEIGATYCLDNDCYKEYQQALEAKIFEDVIITIVSDQLEVGAANRRASLNTRPGLGPKIDLTGEPSPIEGSSAQPAVNDTRNTTNNFYEPSLWRQNYEDFYNGRIDSTTVPPYSAKNVQLAGRRHPDTDVVFDQRGFPIFDRFAAYDTTLPVSEFYSVSYESQMRMATRDLRNHLSVDQRFAARFRPDQISAILAGKKNIPDLTWHHHQDPARMQLVPSHIHSETGHIGGDSMSTGQ